MGLLKLCIARFSTVSKFVKEETLRNSKKRTHVVVVPSAPHEASQVTPISLSISVIPLILSTRDRYTKGENAALSNSIQCEYSPWKAASIKHWWSNHDPLSLEQD
jgi:hypothetical protein